jgi:hypothetical protein
LDEYAHAKWNARRMLGDFGCGIDSSVFTIADLSYSKAFISRYGLLKTNPDNSIIKVKSAYYAVQNVVTLSTGRWNGCRDVSPSPDLRRRRRPSPSAIGRAV